MCIDLEIAYFGSVFMEKYPDIPTSLDKMWDFEPQTTLNVPDLVSNPFCLHEIEGWTVKIFGSIGGFKIFLNEMGFRNLNRLNVQLGN